MTSQGYEERIDGFADGKRLRRFRGMIRNPRDPYCDACGSVLPSFLWGLRDMETGRDYFVGQSCFAAISRLHHIERPFVKASIKEAFERTRGARDARQEEPEPRTGAAANGTASDVRVHEGEELITVFVRMESPSGHEAWGAASAPRLPTILQADGQPVPGSERDATLVACLGRAQRMAEAQLEALVPGATDAAM